MFLQARESVIPVKREKMVEEAHLRLEGDHATHEVTIGMHGRTAAGDQQCLQCDCERTHRSI